MVQDQLRTHYQNEFVRFRQYCLNLSVEGLNTGWEDTLIPLGWVLYGRRVDDNDMIAKAEAWADYHLSVPVQRPTAQEFRSQRSGNPTRGLYMTQYCGEWGSPMVFAELYQHSPSEKLLEAIKTVADHICDNSIRVGDGIIGHSHWSKMPWVDTLYYSSAPLARAYTITGETRYAKEAVEQCLLHAKYLRDERTGCFFHEVDLETGQRTDWLWARGNGWVIMALADTLEYCPQNTPGWYEVLGLYRSLVTGLLRLQHPCGLWRIVPENEESHLETSGAAMIATGITVGIRNGWVNTSLCADVLRSWHELLTWINSEGRLMGCQTPAGHGGWESHKKSMIGERTYGTGSLLRLAAELRQAELI